MPKFGAAALTHPMPDDDRRPPPTASLAPVAQAPAHTTLRPGEALVVPVVEEQIDIATVRQSQGAVRVRKQAHSHVATVELPGWTERAQVERVPIDQPADAVQAPRREGDVWVVPVYEERWVTVKQLYLREELRIATVREPELRTEQVTLLREQVSIERQDPVTGQWYAAAHEAGPAPPGAHPREDGP